MSLDRKFLEAQMLYEKKISDLEAKLAEKEKEIEELKCKIVDFCENIDVRNKIYNQDKISFAVEQLEKVKELLYPELRFDYSLYLRVIHEIDNKIKQIGEMK